MRPLDYPGVLAELVLLVLRDLVEDVERDLLPLPLLLLLAAVQLGLLLVLGLLGLGLDLVGLADVAAYLVTLSQIGPKALAVTTNCSIDFMRKPEAGVDMIAKARLLKLGKQLSVSDVLLYSEGLEKPVARASLTYAIPPKSMDA